MKIKLTVPTELNDIKLSQYQKFLKTTKDSKDNAWINKQAVGIFCNIPDDLVKKITKREFDKLLNTVSNVIVKEGEFKPIITHNGKEYGFIPKLDDISVGEYSDIDSMIQDWQKMDRVMSILYRPIKHRKGDKYLIEDYTGEEKPLDLPMDIVQGSLGFFLNLLNSLFTYIQNYTREAVMQPKASVILEKNGVGIKTFMDCLEETFSNLKMLVSLNYIKCYKQKNCGVKCSLVCLKLVIHGSLLKMRVMFALLKTMLEWFIVQTYAPKLHLILLKMKLPYVI